MQQYFRPEFINRIDEIIVFESLTKTQIADVIGLELTKVSKLLQEQHVSVVFDPSVMKMVLDKGYSDVFGAREIRRTIQKQIENHLSEMILNGNLKPQKKYIVKWEKDTLKIK